MHSIHYTIRRIASADLPTTMDIGTEVARAATDAELLNLGLQRINGDVFSCSEQYRGPHSQALEPFGHVSTGELLSNGSDRYRQLPDAIKADVLQAQVIRAPAPGALAIATASLADQSAAIAEHVGDGVSIDVGTPADEAARLVMVPGNGVDIITVPMSQVLAGQDVVQQDSIEPHRWAGERLPR